MKVLLISSGAGAWPNNGWGAVENLVADFAWALEQQGATVQIYHDQEFGAKLEQTITTFRPDLIHCEYDDHIIQLVPFLQQYPTMKLLLTCHYAWLSQPYRLLQDGYMSRFLFACDLASRTSMTLAVLSNEIADTYEKLGGVPREKIWVFPNGTRTDLIQCRPPAQEGHAICVGKIEKRKNQASLQACKRIDFVGPITDGDFVRDERYKGSWSRSDLYEKLTDYPCLVLFSQAEAHPLVIGEALAAGCAIVCNEVAAANLPREKPWIRVVPDSVLAKPEELDRHVGELCALGAEKRQEIRAWAEENLDWRLRAKTYISKWFPSALPRTLASAEDALRFALIGPGILPIPPPGWGAVEQIIWDHYQALQAKGHHVDIINTPNRQEIIMRVMEGKYDVVHIHYDVFADLISEFPDQAVLITSHYPYLDQTDKWAKDGFLGTFNKICSLVKSHRSAYVFAVSKKDKATFETMGSLQGKVFLMLNGVNVEAFHLKDKPYFADRSVVLGKIEVRKRQHLTYWLNDVDYIGKGEFRHANFRGELGHEILYRILGDFGSMILLSDGENGTPLAVKEGMAAGCGCVLSKAAANELPEDLPWITIVPEEDMANTEKLAAAIRANREVSAPLRKEIREWTRKNWDWGPLMDQYVSNIKSILLK